ncbi:MAG: hypothetical protein J6Y82_07755 [Bacteroidales bacterium]|nr:hypothetical protein [Bacteroidales bacterium]
MNTVRKIAKEYGMNTISAPITRGGTKYYWLSLVDDDGFTLPTGLPIIVTRNGSITKVITGKEALMVTRSFDFE